MANRQSAREILAEKLEDLRRDHAICSDGAQRFALKKQIEETEEELAALPASHPAEPNGAAPRIDLSHLPAGAEHFLGRGPELADLDAAWADGARTAIVQLIAPGGTGKTALVQWWLGQMQASGWAGAQRVYGWSFYSQGTGEDRQASEDHFLATAIDWFGVTIAASANPADKGRALGERIRASRTLLVLDGLEPLQYPPGPMAGELRAPGLQALLTQLADAGHPGLCVVTSREWLASLDYRVRQTRCDPANPHGTVLRLDLGNLRETDGARLLHARGATKAGAATIGPDDPELMDASREVRGHALTVSLLGRYLARTKGGDIRKRDLVELTRADRDARGHAAKVVAAYEAWFAREGETRSRELAALRLLGFFDRPASRELLGAVRSAPPIARLTEALQDLDEDAWSATLANLADCGLAQPDTGTGSLDAHPLVREHLAATLQRTLPEAWREGHRRLYERLKESVPHRPEGLAGLQPLYQAVAHGCLAGLYQETCYEVYIDRILRGTGYNGFYSTSKLGAFGADLGAIVCFFAKPWHRLFPTLEEANWVWFLHQAGFRLCALGRLAEALEPIRAAAEMAEGRKDFEGAAPTYNNLAEVQLSLGRIAEAVANAQISVEYATRTGDAFIPIYSRTTLAEALYQQGEAEQSLAIFAQTELMQKKWQPAYPLLYSVQGFRYCSLLLAGAERDAWSVTGGMKSPDPRLVVACNEVARRAQSALEWAEQHQASILDSALNQLTLARCALYTDLIQDRPAGRESREHAGYALDRLRAFGAQEFIGLGLLTRAWLRHAQGDPDAARADLDEAQRIAARGGMVLYLADIALTRARLFHDRTALATARQLIEKHGYGRRLPELQDAEAAAARWPD